MRVFHSISPFSQTPCFVCQAGNRVLIYPVSSFSDSNLLSVMGCEHKYSYLITIVNGSSDPGSQSEASFSLTDQSEARTDGQREGPVTVARLLRCQLSREYWPVIGQYWSRDPNTGP